MKNKVPRLSWKHLIYFVMLLGSLAFCVPELIVWAQQNNISVDVEYGYDNAAKGGRYLPMRIAIENRGKAISGTLQMKVMESDGIIYNYGYPIEIDADVRVEKEYYIPLGATSDRIYLTIEDDLGEILFTKMERLNVSLDVPELFVGILADEPETLNYFNGIGIHYSTLRTRTFLLETETVPVEEIGLDQLDVIVVNGYKLRNLSEQQTSAIMDWVHMGGVLILGTGDRVDDTLGRFAPELLDDSYELPEIREVHMGDEYTVNSPADATVELACVDIPLHGGNVIFSSDGSALLTAATKEQGLIAVAAFDFSQIQDFCREHPSYIDRFFTSLLGESRINQLAEVVYNGNSSKYWAVQSLINTGDIDKLPNLPIYTTIVVIYLILLGPGIYLFLKKRNLQIYYRRSVIAVSLLFAVIIYLVGGVTRFKSTFFTYASIQDITDDFVTDTTYVNIRNPYNRPYTVEIQEGYSVLPITKSYSYESGPMPAFTGEENYRIGIIEQTKSTKIEGNNIAAFEPRYFRLERKVENTEQVGIVGDIDYFEGILTGTITNQFPYPLEKTCLILYGNMIVIDYMEAGETKQLDEFELVRFPLNYSYVVAKWVMADSDILSLERANLLEFYLDSYLSGYSADARVIAFSAQKEEYDFLTQENAETYGITMITSAIGVNASRDRSIYRSVLMKMPNVLSGNYDATTNAITGSEPVTLEYFIGDDITVESLILEEVSDVFFGNIGSGYTVKFVGNIYFYNHQTGNYDLMNEMGILLDAQQLEPYLSYANSLTIRYVYDGDGTYRNIQLPMPMVAGGAR